MNQRKYATPRCEGCGLWPSLCLCAELPRLSLSWSVVVVQHIREAFKPSSTGKLVERVLANTHRVHWPLIDRSFDVSPLERPDTEYRVLFPREDASLLDPQEVRTRQEAGVNTCFVVLDGTWHQCSRMSRRVPLVSEFPCVRLPDGGPSRWIGRKQHDPRGVSTFEAVARLIAAIEGDAAAQPLEHAFARLGERLQRMRSGGAPTA